MKYGSFPLKIIYLCSQSHPHLRNFILIISEVVEVIIYKHFVCTEADLITCLSLRVFNICLYFAMFQGYVLLMAR